MNNDDCVIFSQRAFNAIVTETISKHPIETGGILIGYALDNGTWIVVENVSPGFKSIHQSAYFEYDEKFVTYLANVLAKQYKGNLKILGLWHRHPGSMDVFSSTDVRTNIGFAQNSPVGAISALVNCDPQLRMTMYLVDANGNSRPIDWIIDNGKIIPERYLALRYNHDSEMPIFNSNGVIERNTAQMNEQVELNETTNDNDTQEVEAFMDTQEGTLDDTNNQDAVNEIEISQPMVETNYRHSIEVTQDDKEHLQSVSNSRSRIKKGIFSLLYYFLKDEKS